MVSCVTTPVVLVLAVNFCKGSITVKTVAKTWSVAENSGAGSLLTCKLYINHLQIKTNTVANIEKIEKHFV